MKKHYALLLSGIMAATTFTSCNRATYSLPTAAATYQAQTVALAPAPTEATADVPALTASASTAPLSPTPGTAPARQAATALATTAATAVATEAAESSVSRPARQSAERQPQAPAKPAKISKGVWIGIGVGVVLAILRIVASS